jgi:hypothetical protein
MFEMLANHFQNDPEKFMRDDLPLLLGIFVFAGLCAAISKLLTF